MSQQPASLNAGESHALTLALDVGTSSVRGALYDGAGSEVEATQARINRTLRTSFDGGAELDADEAVEDVARTVDAVLALAAQTTRAPIETVAVSCFWHSLVGVDSQWLAVTPVLGWADARAARQAEELKQQLDEERAHLRVGCRFHPSYWPAKLLWLRAERSDACKRVRRWLSFGELLSSAFAGEATASVSSASGTGLFNLRACDWDAELLEALNLSRDVLPPVQRLHAPLAGLKESYARRWPRLKSARWFPAVADGAANNVGAGCVNPRRAALMIGTSGAMRVVWDGLPPASIPDALWCYRLDERRVITGGALSDGGGLFHWMTDALRLDDDQREIESALAAMQPDAHGLTILPFWTGERSTHWKADARGAIAGFTMHTRPLDILRAGMEAVAYRFCLIERELARIAPDFEVVATGGALSASRVWTQMLADALGRPLHLSGVNEASSRGAVLLALEALGKLQSIEQARAPLAETFKPDAARHAIYQRALERQQKIYERLIH